MPQAIVLFMEGNQQYYSTVSKSQATPFPVFPVTLGDMTHAIPFLSSIPSIRE